MQTKEIIILVHVYFLHSFFFLGKSQGDAENEYVALVEELKGKYS